MGTWYDKILLILHHCDDCDCASYMHVVCQGDNIVVQNVEQIYQCMLFVKALLYK